MMTRRLVGSQPIRLPDLDVLVHRNFGRHPVIGTAVDVMFPSPFVLQRHELIHIDLVAVDQPFFAGFNSFLFSLFRWSCLEYPLPFCDSLQKRKMNLSENRF